MQKFNKLIIYTRFNKLMMPFASSASWLVSTDNKHKDKFTYKINPKNIRLQIIICDNTTYKNNNFISNIEIF